MCLFGALGLWGFGTVKQIEKRVKKRSKKDRAQRELFWVRSQKVHVRSFYFLISRRTNPMKNRYHSKWSPYNFFNNEKKIETLRLFVLKLSTTSRPQEWRKNFIANLVGNSRIYRIIAAYRCRALYCDYKVCTAAVHDRNVQFDNA